MAERVKTAEQAADATYKDKETLDFKLILGKMYFTNLKSLLLLTNAPQEIYMYSDAMLKHLPKNALKMIEKDILFSKKLVVCTPNHDRRIYSSNNGVQRAEDNLEDRIGKCGLQIDDKYVYRIPL